MIAERLHMKDDSPTVEPRISPWFLELFLVWKRVQSLNLVQDFFMTNFWTKSRFYCAIKLMHWAPEGHNFMHQWHIAHISLIVLIFPFHTHFV